MQKAMAKQIFGVPSLQVASRINDQDNALAVQAACFRAQAKLGELTRLYEEECAKVRAAMLAEIGALEIGAEAE